MYDKLILENQITIMEALKEFIIRNRLSSHPQLRKQIEITEETTRFIEKEQVAYIIEKGNKVGSFLTAILRELDQEQMEELIVNVKERMTNDK